AFCYEPFLGGGSWRELFDLVIVGARKPDFFTAQAPFFEVVNADGLLKPTVAALQPGGAYLGGSAARLERDLGLRGDEILYVGDHMFGDVRATKRVLNWRTALVVRELEGEVAAIEAFRPTDAVLADRMREKQALEAEIDEARLALLRLRHRYGPAVD